MAKEAWRTAFSAGLVALLAGACVVPGCGSSDKKKILPPDGSAGEAGAASAAGGKGGAPQGGRAGTESAGEGGIGAATADAGAGGGAGVEEAGAAGASPDGGFGGSGASGPTLPDIDAGSDCVAPADDTLLSPTAAGLPTAGLAVWLRADHGVYLSADERVCAWVDQSGNDHVYTPANASTRPLWAAAGVGGKEALHFDAPGRYLATGGVLGIPAGSARTLIAVVQLVNTTARCSAVQQGQSGTPGIYVMLDANTFEGVPSHESVYVTDNDYSSELATSTAPRVHIYTLSTMAPGVDVLPNINYRVNGAPLTLVRNNAGLGNGTFEDFSGANYSAVGGDCPDAFIAEVLVYGRALTVPERVAVEASLEARYGIQP